MMRSAFIAGACLLLSALFPPSPLGAKPKPQFGPKPFGVLLLNSGGGADWNRVVAQLKKSFGPRVPIQSVAGPIGPRLMQRAVDKLQASRVERIIVVSVALHSQSDEIDHRR